MGPHRVAAPIVSSGLREFTSTFLVELSLPFWWRKASEAWLAMLMTALRRHYRGTGAMSTNTTGGRMIRFALVFRFTEPEIS
jgi:hypothetical protein